MESSVDVVLVSSEVSPSVLEEEASSEVIPIDVCIPSLEVCFRLGSPYKEGSSSFRMDVLDAVGLLDEA